MVVKTIKIEKKKITKCMIISILNPYTLMIIFSVISMIYIKNWILSIIYIVILIHWLITTYNRIAWLKKCKIEFYENNIHIITLKIKAITKSKRPSLFNPFIFGGSPIYNRGHNKYCILSEETIYYKDILFVDFVQNLKERINMSNSGDLGIITKEKKYCIHSHLFWGFRQFSKDELTNILYEIKSRI